MIKSVKDYRVDDVFKKDASFYYVIPKYQREYSWGISQWRDIYDDISENSLGYFLGSIICIANPTDAYKANPLELVDGQQRLTTVCLLLTALYNRLKQYKEQLNEDELEEFTSLRKSLICKDADGGLILTPQTQNNNLSDFTTVMAENELVNSQSKVKNWGNRKIAKCYKYFIQRLDDDVADNGSPIETLLSIKRRISNAVLVKIEVVSHADAYTLFESLNNRGTPLTAIDLMKNLILSKAENAQLSFEKCFSNWQELLANLTDDYTIQERFFRQYYNAFKSNLNKPFRSPNSKKDPLGSIATRSNLLAIFESLINKNLNDFIDDVLLCGKIYSKFILSSEEKDTFTASLQDLSRIQGAPSYLLLLYLFKKQQELEIKNQDLEEIIQLLVKFFVRRNITDTPSTRDLTRIFMSIISDIEEKSLKTKDIFLYVHSYLFDRSATESVFEEKLKGDIYDENVGAARFILCTLAQKSMTNESWSDLWEQSDYSGKKVYSWTIEHIFPEGKNIPQCWVDMIAGGNKSLAEDYQENYVHKLGNLTLTKYNSALSNYPFDKKRDRQDKDERYIGYKNGLEINKVLADEDSWTVDKIQNRTDKMVIDLLRIFKL